MVNGVEVVSKQEEYRNQTISLVAKLAALGKSNKEIGEEVGISAAEVSTITKELNRKNNKGWAYSRRFF
ncbi:hypothetical protein C6W27_08995 [Bacillus paralicheniformis]|uniref:hypothetical protein n=1 Tax=Bacillus paralicheniformis TaxID=1648923 RepID=UPI000D02FC4E|nr:hypothetical protein [Bacillus paralicheniformis]PRS16527.1 hypothetical protein C6W27_08995 [Bacillus paralicheniformis]